MARNVFVLVPAPSILAPIIYDPSVDRVERLGMHLSLSTNEGCGIKRASVRASPPIPSKVPFRESTLDFHRLLLHLFFSLIV